MKRWIAQCGVLALIMSSLPLPAAPQEDVLDRGRGAYVLSATTQYNDGSWSAQSLLDGTTATGWCSTDGTPHPNTFVIELPRAYRLTTFALDNTGVQERQYPGISARAFKLSASATGPDRDFRPVLSGEAAQGARKAFTLEQPVEAEWLKLELLSNWGDPRYTELMELEATGEPVGSAEPDWLDLASGAVILSATSRHSDGWDPLLLLDGTARTGWCSAQGQPAPHTFLIELPRSIRLAEFGLDNAGVEESSNPGISARAFEVHASTTSATKGFRRVLTGEARRGRRKVFRLQEPAPARWLKLVVTANWGHAAYTELMELEAYGAPAGPLPERKPIAGVYDTNYNLFRLVQDGRQIEGCYDYDNGTLSGTTDGRVIRFQWVEDGPQVGTAIMVLNSDGGFLNGLWYERGQYRGLWHGDRVTDGRQPRCQAQSAAETIGKSLDRTGRAILYGIYFDSGSATLKPESAETLEKVLAAARQRAAQRFVIEGHTDSRNTEAFNLDLSQRRAQAVKDWLVARGIETKRLEAKGYGESRPVADNGTPNGRALNRRVEIALAE